MTLISLRMELHSHTDFDPQDWIEHSAFQLIDETARQGIGVLAITCHRALQWSRELSEYAESAGILLIPGVEASIEGKDVLIYGLESFRHPIGFDDLRKIRRENPTLFTIAPHPFYPSPSCLGRLLFLHHDCFDAIEYCHFYSRQINFNIKAVDAAHKLNKPIIGTSDIHFLSQVGKTTSTIAVPNKTFEAVSAAIKSGNVKLQTRPLTWSELSALLLRMKWLDIASRLRRRGLMGQKPVTDPRY